MFKIPHRGRGRVVGGDGFHRAEKERAEGGAKTVGVSWRVATSAFLVEMRKINFIQPRILFNVLVPISALR